MIAELPRIEPPDWLNRNQEEIQNGEFPLREILKDSLYYPASGTDGDPVKYLAGNVLSFIYADYGIERNEVLHTLKHGQHRFCGYAPVALRDVNMKELCPDGWTPKLPRPGDGNPERGRSFIKPPFAVWSIFQRLAGFSDEHGPERFSLLHICGDGVATFQALYHGNHCVPHAVAVINPGTGFGGNWTDFSDRALIFARSVLENPSGDPELLLYGGICPADDPFYQEPCWPDYPEPVACVPKYDGGYIGVWSR